MLSCFSRLRVKEGKDGGKRQQRRIIPVPFSEALSASAKSDATVASAASAVSEQQPHIFTIDQQQHGGKAGANPPADSGGASPRWQQHETDAAPQPTTPPPSLPGRQQRRTQGQHQHQQQDRSQDCFQDGIQHPSQHPPLRQPLSIAVARPSWASEESSTDGAAWVAGRRRRGAVSGDSSDGSFTSARSSFESAVSAPVSSDAEISGFWPPYSRDPGERHIKHGSACLPCANYLADAFTSCCVGSFICTSRHSAMLVGPHLVIPASTLHLNLTCAGVASSFHSQHAGSAALSKHGVFEESKSVA